MWPVYLISRLKGKLARGCAHSPRSCVDLLASFPHTPHPAERTRGARSAILCARALRLSAVDAAAMWPVHLSSRLKGKLARDSAHLPRSCVDLLASFPHTPHPAERTRGWRACGLRAEHFCSHFIARVFR